MIAPPATVRTDDQIASYFRNAVEAIGADIPWILQDYPLATHVVMSANVIRRIVMENPSLVAIKHEDWPGLEKISVLRGFMEEKKMRTISILVGNNGLFLDFELERGVNGANTGYPFPEMLVETVRLSKSNNREAAHDLFDAHLPLLRYEQQPGVGLAVRKYILKLRGVLSSDVQRKPEMRLTEAGYSEVNYLLSRVARLDPRANLNLPIQAVEPAIAKAL